jgi:pimeloyl-ACP methyl ester carboxylesterase
MNTAPPRLRRAYFECRHGQLHVHNAIPVGGGFDELTTLICLHGNEGSGRAFLALSGRLGHSRSVYSPDLPGCGESDAAAAVLDTAGYADAVGDFLDSMRFRQVDLLGVGSAAPVAIELAVARPKVVRKICLLGSGGTDVAASAPGTPALRNAAAAWQADRRQLVGQPVLSIARDTDLRLAVDSLATQLVAFFAA